MEDRELTPPSQPQPPSIDEQIQAVRSDATLSDERKGERLDLLYRQKVQQGKAAVPQNGQPAEPQGTPEPSSDDALRREFLNAWGPRFDDNIEAVGGMIQEVFGDHANFAGWLQTSGLDASGQTEALHVFGELATLPAPTVETINQTDLHQVQESVDADLRRMWGDKFDENLAAARRAIESFGGAERWQKIVESHLWDFDAVASKKAIVALARIGRRKRG